MHSVKRQNTKLLSKIVSFPYNNELITIPFTITSKRIKYVEINLTKEVKDLYTRNFKTLMKETENK